MRRDYSKFRTLLELKRAEVGEKITRTRNDLQIEDGSDLLDRLLRARERDKAVREIERCAAHIRKIEGALQRLADGTFGLCTRCNRPIPMPRLNAIPWACLCISCQEQADHGAAARLRDYLPIHAA